MADNMKQDRNAGSTEHNQNPGQKAPGRDSNDDLNRGNKPGGVQGSERGGQGTFNREDREREQPGSKQQDKH
jgi:hypothetical protein